MTIDEILKCRSCREIFPEDKEAARRIYLDLIRKYHPDRCSLPDSEQAAAKLNEMYHKSVCSPKLQLLRKFDTEINYYHEYEREDGTMYFGKNTLDYICIPECAELIRNAQHKYRNRYIPQEIMAQMQMALPEIMLYTCLSDGFCHLKISADNNEIPLSEVINFYGGTLESRHAAWVTSRLLGICCFAASTGTVMNCLCPENLLLNPEQHTLRLVGGWWFAADEGSKIKSVQSAVYDAMPQSVRSDGIARYITDLECVKAICRRIYPKNAPAPMLEYAESVCSGNAFDEMSVWDDVLYRSFGERRFVEMKLSINDIYV